MAETKNFEREYVIPLRRFWLNVPVYERTAKAIKAIKKFVAKHMKVAERDLDKVKINMYLNNELWFRGRRHPPAKVKVKVRKEGEIVHVEFVQTPDSVKFLQAKHNKLHKKAAPKDEKKDTDKKPEEKSEEKVMDEKEKEKAVAEQNVKDFKAQAKAEKHRTKVKEPEIHRMALQK